MPHGDHNPHHGGVVMMKGDDLHYEVVLDPSGRSHRVVLHRRGAGRAAGLRGVRRRADDQTRPDRRNCRDADRRRGRKLGRPWPARRETGQYDRTSGLFDSSRAVLDRFTVRFPTVKTGSPRPSRSVCRARRVCDRVRAPGPGRARPAPSRPIRTSAWTRWRRARRRSARP